MIFSIACRFRGAKDLQPALKPPDAIDTRWPAVGSGVKSLADSGIGQIFLTDPHGARVEFSFSAQR